MYHIAAQFPHDSYAECYCPTLDELVAYLTLWLPMSTKVTCREIGKEE